MDCNDDAAKAADGGARSERTKTIRELNDTFRRSLRGGKAVMTAGVGALGPVRVGQAWEKVKRFEQFDADNDPYGEHDFGSFELDGIQLFWKIDCYDRSLRFGSPDPADPEVTIRVITLMLASEY